MEGLAALDVQRVYRGHAARSTLRASQARELRLDSAAVLLTRVGRGHIARNVYMQLLTAQLRVRAATNIQRIARGNAVRRHDREKRAAAADQEARCTRIQRVMRGHWGRVYAERLRFMGAGGVVLNRYKLDPVKTTRKEREVRAEKEKRRAAGHADHGLDVEYVGATCLKTNRAVLIRYVQDAQALNKELALLNLLGSDHVAPLFEMHSDKRLNQHALVFPKPDAQLSAMLAHGHSLDGKKKDLDTLTKTEIIVGAAQALQAIHSKRIAVCNLTASKVCKYGDTWKVLGLELAHKEGEIFGSGPGCAPPGAPPDVTGIPWTPEMSCDSPESVAGWCTSTQDSIKASTRLDLWNLGVLTYRILANKPLFKDRAAVLEALDPKTLLVGKEFEVDMDRVHDVMGKYLLENLLCLHGADRMPAKDVALYAAQIGTQADYYGQAHESSDEEDANIAANDLRDNGVELAQPEEEQEVAEEDEDEDEDEDSNVQAYLKIKQREAAAAAEKEAGAEADAAAGETAVVGAGEEATESQEADASLDSAGLDAEEEVPADTSLGEEALPSEQVLPDASAAQDPPDGGEAAAHAAEQETTCAEGGVPQAFEGADAAEGGADTASDGPAAPAAVDDSTCEPTPDAAASGEVAVAEASSSPTQSRVARGEAPESACDPGPDAAELPAGVGGEREGNSEDGAGDEPLASACTVADQASDHTQDAAVVEAGQVVPGEEIAGDLQAMHVGHVEHAIDPSEPASPAGGKERGEGDGLTVGQIPACTADATLECEVEDAAGDTAEGAPLL